MTAPTARATTIFVTLRVRLRDRNRALADAWKVAFAGVDAVSPSCGDIFEGDAADALVSPANSFGFMDGGIDLAYLSRFGPALQDRVQAVIRERHFGELPVGAALVVPTLDTPVAFLVVAPTMRVPMDVSGTTNAFLAFRAALIAVRRHNERCQPKERIESMLSPGLATAIGKMPYERCARQMRAAWDNVMLGMQWRVAADARASQAKLCT